MASKSGPDIIEDGLVLCLDAASKRSYPGTGTVWTDLKGGVAGTLNNGPVFNTDNGGSLAFDGGDDSADWTLGTSAIDSQSTGITMSINIKTSESSGTQVLFAYSKPSTNNGYRMQFYGDSLRLTFGGVADYNTGVSQSSLANGQWKQITFSIDGSSAKCYIGSLEEASISVGSPSLTDVDQILLAKYPPNNNFNLNCNISQALLYNRALTADEIRRNYLSTKERFV